MGQALEGFLCARGQHLRRPVTVIKLTQIIIQTDKRARYTKHTQDHPLIIKCPSTKLGNIPYHQYVLRSR